MAPPATRGPYATKIEFSRNPLSCHLSSVNVPCRHRHLGAVLAAAEVQYSRRNRPIRSRLTMRITSTAAHAMAAALRRVARSTPRSGLSPARAGAPCISQNRIAQVGSFPASCYPASTGTRQGRSASRRDGLAATLARTRPRVAGLSSYRDAARPTTRACPVDHVSVAFRCGQDRCAGPRSVPWMSD
jgi:hypothetical protein